MKLVNNQFKTSDNNIINYYEIKNSNHTLLLIHAQGTNAMSYLKVAKKLSKKFHVILVDCYGHGKSSHNKEKDFVYYYFMNQYCWNFFPEDSREKIKNKLGEFALRYRKAHPDKTLKVPFWPKKFLEAFKGLNEYDAYFGEAFYDNSFNSGIDYNELLSNIKCNTLFMKAKTVIGEDGLVQGALTDEDLQQVTTLIKNIKVEYFDCGHGIHSEKPKEFMCIYLQIYVF